MTALTLLGLTLLAAPLLSLPRFTDKRTGLAILLGVTLVMHLSIALLTQAAHLFTYPIVVSCTLITLVIGFSLSRPRQLVADWYRLLTQAQSWLPRAEWGLLAVIGLALVGLHQVHRNYTGLISVSDAPGYTQVQHLSYPYPYYSDEWYAIAFIKDSIAHRRLPLTFPYTHEHAPFANLEAPVHALLAELVVLLNLDPLSQYTLLTVGAGTLICVLLYLILRHLEVDQPAATVTAVSTLFITSGANLPGLWHLIPVIVGTISLLLTIIMLARRQRAGTIIGGSLTALLYPPLIIFLLPALGVLLLTDDRWSRRDKQLIAGSISGLVILAGLVLLTVFWRTLTGDLANFTSGLKHLVTTALVYQTYTPDALPRYLPWYVLHPLVLAVALLGAPRLWRQARWLAVMLLTGSVLWLIYSQSEWRVIIEYQRVVLVTAIIAVISAGLGLQHALTAAAHTLREPRLPLAGTAALLIFITLGLTTYTSRTTWQQLILRLETGHIVQPAAPANTYLHPDDLRLFAPLHEQRFLSLPWKGTVLGAATDNHPVSTKPGTISLNPGLPTEFLQADCAGKTALATAHHLTYAYLPPFRCQGFTSTGQSAEGLVLYRLESATPETVP